MNKFLKNIFFLFFGMSVFFAQETDPKILQEYLQLQEYEQALFQARERTLSLATELQKLCEAYQSFLQQYATHPLSHEVRIALAQYTSNPSQREQLLKNLLQNKNLTLSLKERAFLLHQEFFPNQYLSYPSFLEKRSEFLQTPLALRWSSTLYLQHLYLRQEYEMLLDSEFQKEMDPTLFEEEGIWALQILSEYGLGQKQNAEKKEQDFFKKFPKSAYFKLFENKKHKHQLCAQMAPLLVDVDIWEKPFSLKQYHGQEILLLFWAPWDKQSRDALYWLASLRTRYPALVCVGVFFSEKKSEGMDLLLTNTTFRWPQLFGGSFVNNPIAQRFVVEQLPTFYFIDSAGQICYRFQETTFLEEKLQQLQKKK